jgi:hypothetical protein
MLVSADRMSSENEKVNARPAFDKDGVLNGIELVARIDIPDEAAISDGINEISELPEIIFDVSNRGCK